MKTYIAGKITGLANYRKLFNRAEQKLAKMGHKIMNPSDMRAGFEQEEYLHVCFAMIDVCNTVYFLHNWRDSKGATMEHEYAKRQNKLIMYEDETHA